MGNKVVIYKTDLDRYDKSNEVSRTVRNALYEFGLDTEHYGTGAWNPLGSYITPGDCVVIKPNMVLEKNYLEGGRNDCVYTDPSVVAPVLEYVLTALKGSGEVIVGDAPLQECIFEDLIENSGYREMINHYSKIQNVPIKLLDFRMEKTYIKNNVHYKQESAKNEGGFIVNLRKGSAFYKCSKDHLNKMRVTNFDPKILQEHHNVDKHEYCISQYILNADVIINMPKPKTHMKAGITAALKNLVGINASKAFLPHHTNGSIEDGGDAYKTKSAVFRVASDLLDEKNLLIASGDMESAEGILRAYFEMMGRELYRTRETYWEGCWYGNDTIWRTITDLNKILFYADKHGQMSKSIQRKCLIICDMIVSGDHEGPLSPRAKPCGIVGVGDDPLLFDRTIASVMGFDYKKIPSLSGEYLCNEEYNVSNGSHVEVISNNNEWNNKKLSEIKEKSMDFIPSKGWEVALGNKKKDSLLRRVKDSGKPLVIFGAGRCGRDLAMYINDKEYGINIKYFFDNDEGKWVNDLVDGIPCVKPFYTNGAYNCIVSVYPQYRKSIKEEINKYSFNMVLFEED